MNTETKAAQAVAAQYDPDQPSKVDLFGRRPFADKLAQIIAGHPLGEPLVISVVGEWGSGKSTVMGFVRDRLAQLTCKPVEFNPWRFAGEDILLFELLSALVAATGPDANVLTAWQRLKWKLSKRIDAIEKMVGGLANFNLAGSDKIVSGLIGSFSSMLQPELDEVRKQARIHLEKSKLRVVLLLDDIDRLDARDILVIFRLIKLTGDMPNTTFVLAMDEGYVSQILGQCIDGNIITGRSYIDKVVNVRLALPAMPDYKLRAYTLGLLDSIISQSSLKISEEDASRCSRIFDLLCIPLVSTPRKAKLIANAYRFALGLMLDEVNLGDLMILESVRMLSPDIYKAILVFIPRLMRDSLSDNILSNLFEDDADKLKKAEDTWASFFDQLSGFKESEKKSVREALQQWFPQLMHDPTEEEMEEWDRNKRICSKNYFWRYFAGTIQDDDIRDEEVRLFLQKLQDGNEVEICATTLQLVKSECGRAFIHKLNLARSEIPPQCIGRLIVVFASIAKDTPTAGTGSFSGSLRDATAQLAANLVESLKNETEIDSHAINALKSSSDIGWSLKFHEYLPETCRTRKSKDDGVDSWKIAAVEKFLAEKMLSEFAENPPRNSYETCRMVWLIWRNKEQELTKNAITRLVTTFPNLSIYFVASGCSYSDTTGDEQRRWGWKEGKSVSDILELVDLESFSLALKLYFQNRFSSDSPRIYGRDDWEYFTLDEIGLKFLDAIKSGDTHTLKTVG